MTKLDDLGGRAARHLRAAVSDHLEAHPAPVPRPRLVPRSVAALAVLMLVALAAGVLVQAQAGETKLQAADTSEPRDLPDRQAEESGAPGARAEGPSTAASGSGTGEGPSGSDSGTQSTTPATLPGQAPPASDPGNEPPSNEVWPAAACNGTVSAGEVSEYPHWCLEGYNDHPTPDGHPLLVSICREARAGDGVLHFPTRQEADFMITTTGGREVWRWSKTRPAVAHPHERAVRAGGCLTWSVTWDERDQSGRRVPPANYRLSVTVQADEIKGWRLTDQHVRVGEGSGSPTTSTTR